MGDISKKQEFSIYSKPEAKYQLAQPKKRVVVFAEAPTIMPSLYDEGSLTDKMIPYYQKYKKLNEKSYSEYLDDNAYKSYRQEIIEWNKNNPSASPTENKNYEKTLERKYKNPLYIKQEDDINKLLEDFYTVFREERKKGVVANTFLKEANNVKEFYKKDPNIQVDVIPWYEGSVDDMMKIHNQIGYEGMRKKLSELSENDDVVFFGHSGNMLGGIYNGKIAEAISESAPKNCYIGSCRFDDHIKQGFNKSGKNVYYRNDNSWEGFNPKADTFINGMFSRKYINNDIGYKVGIVKNVREGKDYKVSRPLLPEQLTPSLWNLKFKNK